MLLRSQPWPPNRKKEGEKKGRKCVFQLGMLLLKPFPDVPSRNFCLYLIGKNFIICPILAESEAEKCSFQLNALVPLPLKHKGSDNKAKGKNKYWLMISISETLLKKLKFSQYHKAPSPSQSVNCSTRLLSPFPWAFLVGIKWVF